MTDILRERNKRFAKAVETEYDAERIKTRNRHKHLTQERLQVQNMKDAGDKPVMGEAGPKDIEDVFAETEAILAEDTAPGEERLQAAPRNWTYEEIEDLVNDPGNPTPFVERLPYDAIEKLKADPPKTKKFYRAHFAKQMANIVAKAEELLGDDANFLPPVKIGEPEAPPPPTPAPEPEPEEDEFAGLSPAQRAIMETRMAVDATWNAYRYVRSYTSFCEGLSYLTDDKMYPEKLGLAASKIEAEDAKKRLKDAGDLSHKGIIDVPVWKSKRQLRAEAAEAKEKPDARFEQKPGMVQKGEADEFVDLFMAGKLF